MFFADWWDGTPEPQPAPQLSKDVKANLETGFLSGLPDMDKSVVAHTVYNCRARSAKTTKGSSPENGIQCPVRSSVLVDRQEILYASQVFLKRWALEKSQWVAPC